MTYLYTSKMKNHFCRHLTILERDFLNMKICYGYTYILEDVFFDRNIIAIIKSMVAILWLINKRQKTSAVLNTHKLLCKQITIKQGVCSASNIDCPGF
jgi:hypothetical protein